jgi:DDE superfamily endonuclease
MDNLGSHRSKIIRQLIRPAGAKLFLLPKYSPDLNPIEQVFAKLKHLLRFEFFVLSCACAKCTATFLAVSFRLPLAFQFITATNVFYDAALAAAGGEVASARRVGVRIREILTTSRSRPIVIVFSRPQPIVDVSALDVVNGQGATTPHVGAAIPVNCRGVSAMAVDGSNTTSPEVDLLSCYRHSGGDGGDGRQTENQFAHALLAIYLQLRTLKALVLRNAGRASSNR